MKPAMHGKIADAAKKAGKTPLQHARTMRGQDKDADAYMRDMRRLGPKSRR